MDPRSFDTLARSLARPHSRRGLLGAALALAAGAFAHQATDAQSICPPGQSPNKKGDCFCPPGTDACPDGCFDLDRDTANCGACGQGCFGGTCKKGECRCPSGSVLCDGVCLSPQDLAADEDNCGACGVAARSARTGRASAPPDWSFATASASTPLPTQTTAVAAEPPATTECYAPTTRALEARVRASRLRADPAPPTTEPVTFSASASARSGSSSANPARRASVVRPKRAAIPTGLASASRAARSARRGSTPVPSAAAAPSRASAATSAVPATRRIGWRRLHPVAAQSAWVIRGALSIPFT
jgi:hypothetical protein